VGAYIHPGGKVGVLIEVNCETDFVAKTDEFQRLVRDLAMQVAASAPRYVRREDVPASEIESERQIYRAQAEKSGKPAQVLDRIVSGQLDRYFQDTCLLEQAYIKQSDRTVGDVLKEAIVRFGVNVEVRRFSRFQLGEHIDRQGAEKDSAAGGDAGA
jgi:elongation factor Ts